MARPYSDDLRERVAGSVLGGRSCRETARLFGVSVASAAKWSQRQRATGSAGAKPMGGRRKRVLLGEQGWIIARLTEQPELTVRALAVELAGRGIRVSPNTVWSLLRHAAVQGGAKAGHWNAGVVLSGQSASDKATLKSEDR